MEMTNGCERILPQVCELGLKFAASYRIECIICPQSTPN